MSELHPPIPDLGPGNQRPPCLVIEACEGTVVLDMRQFEDGITHVPLDAEQARALAAALVHFAAEIQP